MKITTLALGLMLLAGNALANMCPKCQMCCDMTMDAGKKVDMLTLVLDLNDKQKAEVKKLVDAKMDRMKAMHEQHMKQAEEAKESFQANLKAMLSEKQKKKWDEWKDLQKCDHK